MKSNDPGPLSLAEVAYRLADELRSLACQGLRFTDSEYDRERYERILQVSVLNRIFKLALAECGRLKSRFNVPVL